jgi:uncharacterized damage-inducible protein DinB
MKIDSEEHFPSCRVSQGERPMNKDHIQTLYDYNRWANDRILDTAAKLSHEEYMRQGDYPHRFLHGVLTHVMFAEWIWRNRWLGIFPTTRLLPEEFPTFESLRLRWQAENIEAHWESP